ncbi:ankyrin repeat domain-containing protein [Thermoproteota archaeon]
MKRSSLLVIAIAFAIIVSSAVSADTVDGDTIEKGETVQELLFDAVTKNNIKDVRILLKLDSTDVDAKDELGLTALHHALMSGFTDIAKLIINAGADLDIRDSQGASYLHYAFKKGYPGIARRLIDKRPDLVNARTNSGFTPIHYAALFTEQDSPDVMELALRYLILKGGDVNAKDNEGVTPLHVAADSDNLRVARLLVSKGAELNSLTNEEILKDGDTVERNFAPLHFSSAIGDVPMTRFLLSAGADKEVLDGDSHTPLILAAREGNADIVELLIDRGVEKDAAPNRWTALHEAAGEGKLEVAKALLSAGAKVDPISDWRNATPLHWAAQAGHTEIVKLLIQYKADIEARSNYGETPLMRAVYGNRGEVVKLLIDKGADLSVVDNAGRTPMSKALYYGRKDMVKLLIEKGVDANSKDKEGWPLLCKVIEDDKLRDMATVLIDGGAEVNVVCNDSKETPLHKAAHIGDPDLVSLLISKEAKVYARDKYGQTPLHCAARQGEKGNIEAARILIDNGAEVDARDNDRNTPLHVAVYGSVQMVDLLIGNKAKVNVKNKRGHTPTKIAKINGHTERERTLRKAGGHY